MTEVIGVRFKKTGKIYYFDPLDMEFEVGDPVIVETRRGIEYGSCLLANTTVGEDELRAPLKEVIRKADELDKRLHLENIERAREAFDICQLKIEDHQLDMKLVGSEYTFDNNKLIFYFVAKNRVDFRRLVKDLAYIFKVRIELRQIGVRDQSKMIGGLGVCGREVCCHKFLREFEPVTMNMAKDQKLSLNPAKISGICGRLMCCLGYEHDNYEESLKKLPHISSKVRTPEGLGVVVSSQTLAEKVKVKLKDEEGSFYTKDFDLEEVDLLGCGGCPCC